MTQEANFFPQAPLLTIQSDHQYRLPKRFTSPVAHTVCLQLICQHCIILCHFHPSLCSPTWPGRPRSGQHPNHHAMIQRCLCIPSTSGSQSGPFENYPWTQAGTVGQQCRCRHRLGQSNSISSTNCYMAFRCCTIMELKKKF